MISKFRNARHSSDREVVIAVCLSNTEGNASQYTDEVLAVAVLFAVRVIEQNSGAHALDFQGTHLYIDLIADEPDKSAD